MSLIHRSSLSSFISAGSLPMLKAMHHDSAAGRAKGSFFPLEPLHLTDTHPTRLVHSLQQQEQRPVRTKGREIKTFLMPHSSWVAWEVTHSCSHNLYNSHKQSLILLIFKKNEQFDKVTWTGLFELFAILWKFLPVKARVADWGKNWSSVKHSALII